MAALTYSPVNLFEKLHLNSRAKLLVIRSNTINARFSLTILEEQYIHFLLEHL